MCFSENADLINQIAFAASALRSGNSEDMLRNAVGLSDVN